MKYYSKLEELYYDLYKLIFTYIGDYVNDINVSQEIASAVWVKVAEKPDKYLQMEKTYLKNYLRVMVRTIVSDYYCSEKKNRDKVEKLKDYIEPELSVEEYILIKENLNELVKNINLLTQEEKDLLYLKFESNKSSKDIGAAFNLSDGAIRVRQYRIINKLKEAMKTKKEK